MKIKLLILFLAFINTEYSSSQNDTIRGKIISSINMKKPIGDIYIFEKGTTNGTIADSLGIFTLVSKSQKEIYVLEISVGNYSNKTYKYKSSWSKRKKTKSIVINAECKINKEKARKDWQSGTPKLYINSGIAPVENSIEDKIFEKKYNIEYVELGCEAKIYECVTEYNFYIIKVLDIKYKREWRKTKREEIVGVEDYSNTIKTCLD